MTLKRLLIYLLIIGFYSCNPFYQDSNLNWKKEWRKNENILKEVVSLVLNKKIKIANNRIILPENLNQRVSYPISIEYGCFINNSDSLLITLTFYLDNGLLDHYSGFVYTNSLNNIDFFNGEVENGGNDFKIEDNWYMINN